MNLKKDFPVFDQGSLHYLDSAATSLTPKVVINAMNDFYAKTPANVHRGSYQLSHEATEKYETARNLVAAYIHANPDEVIFTSGATQALNMIAGMLKDTLREGDEIITSELEHHSNFLPWQRIAREKKCVLKFVPLTPDGEITLENLETVLSAQTKVIALTAVSNTFGATTPLKAIKKRVGEQVMLIADAAQAMPHQAINVQDLDIDFLAFSGHKVCGPYGIGVLYGKKVHLDLLEPPMVGGEMNDLVTKDALTYKETPLKFEAGTPPVAEAIGLASAIEYIKSIGLKEMHIHIQTLKHSALDKLSAMPGIQIYNPKSDGATILFNVLDIHPHDVVTFLDDHHVAVRAGHHCAQLVMHWLGVHSTLRASFYLYNTLDDVDALMKGLNETIAFFKGDVS